jgi:hypothetical protein
VDPAWGEAAEPEIPERKGRAAPWYLSGPRDKVEAPPPGLSTLTLGPERWPALLSFAFGDFRLLACGTYGKPSLAPVRRGIFGGKNNNKAGPALHFSIPFTPSEE